MKVEIIKRIFIDDLQVFNFLQIRLFKWFSYSFICGLLRCVAH